MNSQSYIENETMYIYITPHAIGNYNAGSRCMLGMS